MSTPGDDSLGLSPGTHRPTDPSRLLHDISDPDRLRALVDAVLAVSTDLSLPAVLRRIVGRAMEVVGARYGALGVLDEAGQGLAEFIHLGVDDATVAAIGRLPEGLGILGLLIVEPQPIRVDDLAAHPDASGFPSGHPPMRSFLGVPIEVRGQVFGNLYLTEKHGGGPFSADDEALAVVLAGAAGVAIENARLHTRDHDRTLLEDRERIAAELHDRVIQRLFATGLGLQSMVRATDPEGGAKIQQAVDDLDATIGEIRSTIFGLRARRAPGQSLRLGLLQLATEASGALGFEPSIRIEGPVETIGDTLSGELLAVARELLLIVARSAVDQVELALHVRAGRVELAVSSRGSGPHHPTVEVATAAALDDLAARARNHGGDFALEAGPGGVTARWWVALSSP